MQSENEDSFYDIEEATRVVYDNISNELREKFNFHDIMQILDLELDYMDSVGLLLDENEPTPICDYPKELDWEKMKYYVITNAVKEDIFITDEELENIFEAESIYYDQNGAFGSMDIFLN